jgi:hypothetical protein
MNETVKRALKEGREKIFHYDLRDLFQIKQESNCLLQGEMLMREKAFKNNP